jgi:hypothetical protein
MKLTQINTTLDVERFFNSLLESGLNFHPDTPFSDYVNYSDSKPCFTESEANKLDATMDRAFYVCQGNNVDVYKIALDCFNAFTVNS